MDLASTAEGTERSKVNRGRASFSCEFQSRSLDFVSLQAILPPGVQMRLQNLGDKGLVALYESLRRRTTAANGAGLRSRVIGQSTKDYAERLRAEMERRRLQFTPIEWRTPQ